MSFSLPTGEVIKRNKNTIIVFVQMLKGLNCNEFEASNEKPFHKRTKVETSLGRKNFIERVSAMTMFQ